MYGVTCLESYYTQLSTVSPVWRVTIHSGVLCHLSGELLYTVVYCVTCLESYYRNIVLVCVWFVCVLGGGGNLSAYTVDSLAHGRCSCNFKLIIFKLISRIPAD